MTTLIKKSIEKSVSYTTYKSIIANLLTQGKVSGLQQSEELIGYTQLNQTRIKRLEKTITLNPLALQFLTDIDKQYIWLVITEGWCGDAAQILPVIHQMANTSSNIELRLVFRDENLELMDKFLTNGGRAIPKLLIIDPKKQQIIGSWGPRPQGAVKLIESYKAQHGVIDQTAKTELQLWYLQDKGQSVQNEIIQLMDSL